MKSFEEFKQMVADTIKNYLPDSYKECTVTIQNVDKPNGVFLTGIIVHLGTGIAPTVYLEPYYDLYKRGEKVENVIRQIAEIICKGELRIDGQEVRNFISEHWRSNVYMVLVNREHSASYIKNFVKRDLLDLCIVYDIQMEIGDERGNVRITKDILRMLGVTEEEVYEAALKNTSEASQVLPIASVLAEMGMPVDEDFDMPPIMVVTNKEKIRGAACILANNVTQYLNHIKTDLYVIPSSIHEMLVVPVDLEAGEGLRELIPQVNGTVVSQEEFLSDNLYIYRYQTGELEIA